MPTTTMPGVAACCARMALRPRISLVASSTRTFHSPLALLAPNRASPVRTQLSCFSSTSSFRDTTTPAQKPGITWDEFLLLRRRRRYVNLFASVGTAVGAVAATVPVAMSYELEDKIASATGLDPFIAFGLMITAVGGFGWLMGPFVGNAGFLLANRRIRADIASRERDFYNHIKRFRADPTSSSVSNPVPDYYGEKISSVADYRRWLKDQRAFNRKKSKNLL